MGEYLKDCEYITSLVDDLVVTCDEVENIPKSTSISPSNGINYWLIAAALLAIACLLLLLAITVKYHMKSGLTISCLLLY